MASRKQATQQHHPYNPRFVAVDEVLQPSRRRLRRLKIILMSNGCSVPTCTMCPFTNENNYGRGSDRDTVLVDQVRDALSPGGPATGCDCLALYNDGSFFAPHEISDVARSVIADLVAESGVGLLTVESLPQFVTEARLLPFLAALGGVSLEVGLGLQSAHPVVREYCVNTSFDNRTFERTVALLRRYGVQVKTYLMLKPPFLTETEAVGDALESIAYCRALGAPFVTLCPTRIAPHTLAWRLWEAGAYTPPGLWTIVDTVRRAPSDGTLRVACINLRGGSSPAILPDSCPRCADILVEALEAASLGNRAALNLARCSCAGFPVEPVPLPTHGLLLARIQDALDKLTVDTSAPPSLEGVA
jgi:radical SAM enzyme (TIGR01210 family)